MPFVPRATLRDVFGKCIRIFGQTLGTAWLVANMGSLPARSTDFFPLDQVRPGLHGVGRTVFSGDRVEEFQVEILGVLENLTPKGTIVLARLSGGPLAETGVLQGMSGSPVYIDGKLMGAIALGFPFSKAPITGIQPIAQMLIPAKRPPQRFGVNAAQSGSSSPPRAGTVATLYVDGRNDATSRRTEARTESDLADSDSLRRSPSLSFDSLREIFTPLSLSGFPEGTVSTFRRRFLDLGLEPQEGVSGRAPLSQSSSRGAKTTGRLEPGSMISVQLMRGDLNMSADGTVTYIDGQRLYAFGHRFLNAGSSSLPFARAEVVALLPTLNSSFKLSAAHESIGVITEDHSSAIAGEIGGAAQMIPLDISVRGAGSRDYHIEIARDRLLTPLLTQTALFASMDATERTVGMGAVRVRGQIEFDNPSIAPLAIADVSASDLAAVQQASGDAAAFVAFLQLADRQELRIRHLTYQLEPIERKQQLRITNVWTSQQQVRPGERLQIFAEMQGDGGKELVRGDTFVVPIGAPAGALNVTVSDASTLNAQEYAGLSPAGIPGSADLVDLLRAYRGSEAVYARLWRAAPSFAISPGPKFELTNPPPSVALMLANTFSSASGAAAASAIRGAQVAELRMPVDGFFVSGAKTIQVEVKD